MDRKEVISFLHFLSEASVEEIMGKKKKLLVTLELVDPKLDVASDIRFLLRKVDEELVVRADLNRVHRQQKG